MQGLYVVEELVSRKKDRFIVAGRDLDEPFFFFSILNTLHQCGAAYQAEILSAASGAEMADVDQTLKVVPLIMCEVSFRQNVCELVFGVNVLDLDFGVQFNPIKQPIQCNSER